MREIRTPCCGPDVIVDGGGFWSWFLSLLWVD